MMRWITAALLLWTCAVGGAAAQQQSTYEQLEAFSLVLNDIRLNYVDSVDVSVLVRAAIEGMLRSLDPHSYLLVHGDAERFADWMQGHFLATGLVLERENGGIAVAEIVPESPADRAGVLAGDRLVFLDGESVVGSTLRQIQARLDGATGTKVRLRFERGPRGDAEQFSVTLKRTETPVRSTGAVTMIDSITGYLRLSDFKTGAGRDVHEGLTRLASQGARQVLLDLRGNPGGVLAGAVEVASEFLPADTPVFRTRGRKAQMRHAFTTTHAGEFSSTPLIVLIDRGTASAAEALAACLQDHDRALITGQRSFGKALEQMPFPLPTGDVAMLTVGRVISPSGRVIQRPYSGLPYERYVAGAGEETDTPDTAAFTTDHGRTVRGGDGVAPDVVIAPRPPPPVWWSIATDSGFGDAVADSVARIMPGDQPLRWIDASDEWRALLLRPFLARIRSLPGAPAPQDTAWQAPVARHLAARVAEVKWGGDVYERFLLHNDPDIAAAVPYFPRITELLAGHK